jgi:CRP/FNR family cyclic AMP-dependent transcriptional regulator
MRDGSSGWYRSVRTGSGQTVCAVRTSSNPQRVRLLDQAPELGAGLSKEDFEQARQYLLAEVVQFPRGSHRPSEIGGPELLGLLVLEGLVVRSVRVAERQCGELVGPGALLRPWDHFGRYAPMPFEVSWRVVEPVALALLDQRVAVVGARWPALMHEIVCRAVERSHALALNVAIHCLQHVELRLLVLFWHLADRFGRVTGEGTVIPLALSHGDLAELIGSQRPSVSARLGALARKGEVTRRPDRTWLLSGEPPGAVRDLRTRAERGSVLALNGSFDTTGS